MLSSAMLPIGLGVLGMIAALLTYMKILQSSGGAGRVKEIADEIHLGAMVFMAAEYKRLAIFCLVCIVALYFSLGAGTAIAFFLRSGMFRCCGIYWNVYGNSCKC